MLTIENINNVLNTNDLDILFSFSKQLNKQEYEFFMKILIPKINVVIENYDYLIQNVKYHINNYSDDELYLADLKSKHPNSTDEELLSNLNNIKADKQVFNEKIKYLRSYYKEQEDEEMQELQNVIHKIQLYAQFINLNFQYFLDKRV